jgi:hypothetical protein
MLFFTALNDDRLKVSGIYALSSLPTTGGFRGFGHAGLILGLDVKRTLTFARNTTIALVGIAIYVCLIRAGMKFLPLSFTSLTTFYPHAITSLVTGRICNDGRPFSTTVFATLTH